MITSSLVIGVVTTVVSWAAKLITMKMQASKELREAELRALNAKATVTKEAREYNNKGFQYTRRFIAILTALCVMGLPLLIVPLFHYMYSGMYVPDITFGYNTVDKGFWPFTSDTTTTTWRTFQGIVITPWHTDMFAWVMGMYFGDRLGNGKH